MANVTVTTAIYPLSAPFGLNFYQVDSPVSASGIAGGTGLTATNQGPTQTVGTIVPTSIGFLLYGVATASLTVNKLNYMTQDATYGAFSFTIVPVAASVAALGPNIVGTPLTAMTVGQFGWFWVGGGIWNIDTANTVTALAQLTVSTSVTGRADTGGSKYIGATNLDTTNAAAATRVFAPSVMMINQLYS